MEGIIRRQQLVNWVKKHKIALAVIGAAITGVAVGTLIGAKIPLPKKDLVFIDTDELVNYISKKLNMDELKVTAVLNAEAIFQTKKGLISDPDGSFVKAMEDEIGEMISSGRVS